MDLQRNPTPAAEPQPPMARAAVPKRAPLTHFLCIPLVNPASRPELSASVAAFRREVVGANEACFRVPEDAVRPLGTLHLTLGVMSLQQEERVEKAAEVLRGLRMREMLGEVRRERDGTATAPAGEEGSLAVSLRGLRSMQAASQARVLYAPIVDTGGLMLPFCERLRAKFLEAGLMEEDGRPLLLHATVVNTIYVRGGGKNTRGKGKGRRQALTLNAGNLLERYEDYVWLERFVVDRVAICRMGAKTLEGADDGLDGDGAAYEVEAEAEI